jgi:hypothetical protein
VKLPFQYSSLRFAIALLHGQVTLDLSHDTRYNRSTPLLLAVLLADRLSITQNQYTLTFFPTLGLVMESHCSAIFCTWGNMTGG